MLHIRAELPDEYKKPVEQLLKKMNARSTGTIRKRNLFEILLKEKLKREGIDVAG